jgi:endonuclease YncB( thermonuclease family)
MIYTYPNVLVDNVVDGDTFDAMVDLGFETFKRVRFRLKGINCPEVHGITKPEGLHAKSRTTELVLNKRVTVECHEYEKFGRSLAIVRGIPGYPVEQTLNTKLLEEGLAIPYMV